MNKFHQCSWVAGLLLVAMFNSGCEGFFGKKTDPGFIDVPIYDDRQVAYVPIQPVMDNFIEPVDVIPGFDELIYVVDAGSEEIISFDQSGNELGRFPVPGVQSVIQDRSLDLLAIGTMDTLINGTTHTLSAIYRIELKNALYGLSLAHVENTIIHPFYYKVSFDNGKDPLVRFQNIGLRADNTFYVTRTGPNNSPLQFGGPDDAVLLFKEGDKFLTPITVQTASGFFNDYFKEPVGITTKAQPPQSTFVNSEGDFIVTMFDPNAVLKVQYIDVIEDDNGVSYLVQELPTGDTAKADGFLYTPDRFAAPADITYSGDGTNYMWIVDSEKDSVYQFTNTGLEGVKPPAGAETSKNILVSFGGTGNSLTQFRNPTGVAYLDQILYVADAGNGRVLRFKLTTDFD